MRTQVAQVEAQKMGDGEPSVNSFLFYRPKDSRFVLTLYVIVAAQNVTCC